MSIRAIHVKGGQAVRYKDGVWSVVSNEKVAKGKGQSYQSIQLRNIQTGQLISERFRTTEEFDEVFVDRREMEYLYADGDGYVLMDLESFEQVHVPSEMIGEKSVFLTPNIHVQVCIIEGRIIGVELPNTVVLTVTDTPPQIKGATATNQEKEALCDTGARVKVPPFIENGEQIQVDTRTGEYIGRA
ncbi:MAG: elongation factor P [Phycisphaerae bacterium]